MGRDKALVPFRGEPMISAVVRAVGEVGCRPIVAIGGDRAALERLGLDARPDHHPGDGPLGGIITALHVVDADAALVVPCDVPLLTADALRPLVDRWRDATREPGDHPDVLVAHTGRREPLCSIWSVTALPILEARFDAGERAIHRCLEVLRVVDVPIDASALHNVNTPEELASARRVGSGS